MRFKLVCELFDKFRREFNHMFTFQSTDAGNEFISFFITSLYCRLYIPTQTMVRRGENFSEMYMIFEGKVVLSLRRKFEHEYFMLYSTNYFGDYQILKDHKATETYCAFSDHHVLVHCLKSRDFIDLLKTFPDAMAIFFLRAEARRREFRRIRKMYERWVGFDGR